MTNTKRKALGSVAALLAVGLVLPATASAQDFSPKVKFSLSDTKVRANPEMAVHVEQDEGEEELKHVTLTVPKGFGLPSDEQVPDGEVLGEGEIVIAFGPGCRGLPPPTLPSPPLPAELSERGRTDEEADRGVYAVWVLDISGVTEIVLEVTGSKRRGWKLDGDIPANADTCPPFSFDLTVGQTSESGVKILTNPVKPGRYPFTATFLSQDSPAKRTIKQVVRIKR